MPLLGHDCAREFCVASGSRHLASTSTRPTYELMVQITAAFGRHFSSGVGGSKSLRSLSQGHPSETKLTLGAAACCISGSAWLMSTN